MQTQNKFSSVVFGNWVVKVLSFVSAVAIVIAVRFLNVTDRTVTVPLTVLVAVDSPYEPVSLVPSSIDVVITGDDSVIYLVDPSLISASVNFADVAGEGIARRVVDLSYDEDIFTANGLTVSASPSTVRILFKVRESN